MLFQGEGLMQLFKSDIRSMVAAYSELPVILLLCVVALSTSGCVSSPSTLSSDLPLYTDRGYPVENGHPVWFLNPRLEGELGVVGIAGPQKKGGYAAQKKVARMAASAELARQVEVFVESELSRREVVRTREGEETLETQYGSRSKAEAYELTKRSTVKDEWLNRATGELYLWVVVGQ